MKSVDWVELVLRGTVKVKGEAGAARIIGMPEIAQELGGRCRTA